MQPFGCITSIVARKDSADLDAVFHALADSTRRTILEELTRRENQSLFEICVRLEGYGLTMKRQSISKHLGVLEAAGLIETTWQGRTKLHTTRLPAAVPLITRWLQQNEQD